MNNVEELIRYAATGEGANTRSTSVRLDAETERLLARLTRRTRRTKSEVIREAIGRLAREEGASAPVAGTPYAALKHLIGVARGGPRHLSAGTGDRFRKLIATARRG